MNMWEIPCNFGTDEEEFKHYVGRKPENAGEMAEWVRLLGKGVSSQLDWKIINGCAAEEFR